MLLAPHTVHTSTGHPIEIAPAQDAAINALAGRYGVPREEMRFAPSEYALDMIRCDIPAGERLVSLDIDWEGAVSTH